MSVKKSWKKVGKDFGKIGSDLKDGRVEGNNFAELGVDFGKAVVRSVKKGTEAIDRWAEDDDTQDAADGSKTQDGD